MNDLNRETEIEKILETTDYKDWRRVSKLDNVEVPMVDFQQGNTYVSLKVVDTNKNAWFGDLSEHIEKFAETPNNLNKGVPVKKVDVRVQPGGMTAQQAAELRRVGEIEYTAPH